MINIATLNVKGLATRKKLSETLTLLKTYNHIDIFALQETNISLQTRKTKPDSPGNSPHSGPNTLLSLSTTKTSIS